ncbi:unnamed protein product [Allacma fusca]|uniref:Uncharacterized protein n=1 Tax=Allacma fusca TaxID=39272 RepID=A0A8J2JEY3_9HEXA|nr:unnamed protein product [Allacma fusca]
MSDKSGLCKLNIFLGITVTIFVGIPFCVHILKTHLQQSYEDDSTKSANIKCISPTQISVSNTTKITGAKCPELCGLMMASLLKTGSGAIRMEIRRN